MNSEQTVTRRSFIGAVGVASLALAGLAVTGCSGGSGGGASSTGKPTSLDELDTSSFPTTPLKLYDAAPASYEELPTVSADELKKMIDDNTQMVMIDVNPKDVYQKGHIDGAIYVEYNFKGFTQDPELPRGVPLIFMCQCAAEEDSGTMGYSAVKDWGYRNVELLKGGTPGWKDAGYELVTSK